MARFRDLSGQRFGRLTAIERDKSRPKGRAYWFCRCDCGNEAIVLGARLASGNTKSCGCLKREALDMGHIRIGVKGTPIYTVWYAMKQRCNYSKNINYHYYGGRGIRVCDEWVNDAVAFRDWADKNGWRPGLTIDRIDPNGNYEPSNCRFITIQEQQRNRRPRKKCS